MSLSDTSIKRPVFAMVMSIILIIMGFVGFRFLQIREYPSIDPPIVTVTTNYPGANSDVIETQITEPLEEGVNGIEGIRTLTSTSREGVSSITVEFNLDRDLESAANDVRDRVSRSLKNLPNDVDPPIVEKADADATPIIFLTVYSDTRNILEVSKFASDVIGERMQTINGVGSVRIFGEKKLAIRLRLDPSKMAAYKVTPLDIQSVLNKQNVDLPSGKIEGWSTELTIRTFGRLNSIDEFNNLTIKEDNGRVVKLSDIGFAEYGAENERSALKRNGRPGVGVAVLPQAGANVIEISDEFHKRLEKLKTEVPEDIKLDLGFDFSTFVRKTLSEVEETIFIAFGLVVFIIFLFLRDWRSTLIPVIAIPISIIATFFVMYLLNFSINVLSLVGIILAIGLVCDDAIVVLENIYTKIEDGMSPKQAAFKGAREIYFAVISTTITLAAVFFPILFIQGQVGRLFREFGVVIAVSVLISAFVALSLSPMLSAFILKRHDAHNKFYNMTEPFFVWLTKTYNNSLEKFMRVRWVSFILVVAAFAIIFFIGSQLKSELAPLEDRSNIRISATAPEGASYEFTERYLDEMTKYVMDSIPEVSSPLTLVAIGGGSSATNTGGLSLYLKDPDERERSQKEIFAQLSKALNSFYGVRGFPTQPPTIGARFGGQPIQFVIMSNNFDSLANILPKFLDEAKKNPILQFVDANLKVNKPELAITIDRGKADALGVTIQDVAQVLQTALAGVRYGYFIQGEKQYQIIGQLEREYRDKPGDLDNIYVKNKRGELIQLSSLVSLKEEATAPSRFRFNRFSAATISAAPVPPNTLGDGLKAMEDVAKKVLNENYTTALAGESRDFAESSSSLLFTFVFAIVIIFLVLAAQFESFIDPFIILLTVPLAITGAILSLWITGQTINIFSQIGIIMLVGLVTKNAILIVEFANQRKQEGLTKLEAVIEAAEARFRPIIMTTLATTLGILPIALGFGAGSRISLGIAVVGGLLFSTFLTLFIVPAIYSYIAKAKANVIEDEEPEPEKSQITDKSQDEIYAPS
ncbi:MAG: efflux RND transporter permease subunit [Bacteroidetes bacterium]|nr:efflux RND transporter permease subunit [Bacteroidota bacterium]